MGDRSYNFIFYLVLQQIDMQENKHQEKGNPFFFFNQSKYLEHDTQRCLETGDGKFLLEWSSEGQRILTSRPKTCEHKRLPSSVESSETSSPW